MAERFSTQFIKQQGARRKTVEGSAGFVNTFQDSRGGEFALNSANVGLTDKSLVTSSLNSEQYFFAKSFFINRGATEPVAVTLAVVAMDTAKLQEISVMRLLEPLRQDPQAALQFESYVAANLFRPVSSQQTYLIEKTNDDSLRGRTILP